MPPFKKRKVGHPPKQSLDGAPAEKKAITELIPWAKRLIYLYRQVEILTAPFRDAAHADLGCFHQQET
jgi:hypothetical protein